MAYDFHAQGTTKDSLDSTRVYHMNHGIPLEERLVLALDVPTICEAKALVRELGDTIKFYKIGLELIVGGGLELVPFLKDLQKKVFLDMKLLDIGNTVEMAVANVAKLGADFLTVHGVNSKTMKAAVTGASSASSQSTNPLRLLAVTVMTDRDQSDLVEEGITAETPLELVRRRSVLAESLGFSGVIASALEASEIRKVTGPNFVIKTPGIRPTGFPAGDQLRVTTPRQAIEQGADYLVVGRPILQATDKLRVANNINAEIAETLENLHLK